jgi:hypothetical protein
MAGEPQPAGARRTDANRQHGIPYGSIAHAITLFPQAPATHPVQSGLPRAYPVTHPDPASRKRTSIISPAI